MRVAAACLEFVWLVRICRMLHRDGSQFVFGIRNRKGSRQAVLGSDSRIVADWLCHDGWVFRFDASHIYYGLNVMSLGLHAFLFGLQFALGALLVVPFFVVPVLVMVSIAICRINPVVRIDFLPLILCPLIWSVAESLTCHMSERWLSVLYFAGAIWSIAFLLRVCIVLILKRNVAFLAVLTGLLPVAYIVWVYVHY